MPRGKRHAQLRGLEKGRRMGFSSELSSQPSVGRQGFFPRALSSEFVALEVLMEQLRVTWIFVDPSCLRLFCGLCTLFGQIFISVIDLNRCCARGTFTQRGWNPSTVKGIVCKKVFDRLFEQCNCLKWTHT
jgi:hypothetical protein